MKLDYLEEIINDKNKEVQRLKKRIKKFEINQNPDRNLKKAI